MHEGKKLEKLATTLETFVEYVTGQADNEVFG